MIFNTYIYTEYMFLYYKSYNQPTLQLNIID